MAGVNDIFAQYDQQKEQAKQLYERQHGAHGVDTDDASSTEEMAQEVADTTSDDAQNQNASDRADSSSQKVPEAENGAETAQKGSKSATQKAAKKNKQDQQNDTRAQKGASNGVREGHSGPKHNPDNVGKKKGRKPPRKGPNAHKRHIDVQRKTVNNVPEVVLDMLTAHYHKVPNAYADLIVAAVAELMGPTIFISKEQKQAFAEVRYLVEDRPNIEGNIALMEKMEELQKQNEEMLATNRALLVTIAYLLRHDTRLDADELSKNPPTSAEQIKLDNPQALDLMEHALAMGQEMHRKLGKV